MSVDPSTANGASAVCWPPRVRKSTLRRLYASIATDRLDEKLVDDVGITLYMRCRAIMAVSQARKGEVLCPVCERAGRLLYTRRSSHALDEHIRCAQCDWQTTWADYSHTFQRKQLNEGGAGGAFRRYLDEYPKCRTPWEKMLAIDLLIHEFHFSLRSQPNKPTRAACVNLIEGKLADVVACLNEISGVSNDQPELADHFKAWKKNCAKVGNSHPR